MGLIIDFNLYLFNFFSYNLYIYEIIFLFLNFIYIIIYFFFNIKNIKHFFFISNCIFIIIYLILTQIFDYILIQLLLNNLLSTLTTNIIFNNNIINIFDFYNLYILTLLFSKIKVLNGIYLYDYNKNIIFNNFLYNVKNIIIIIFFICSYYIYLIYNKIKVDFIKLQLFLILIVFCNLCIVSIQNLILVIICMEIQNLSLIFLMSLKKNQMFISQLNLRFFILNSFGSIFMFFGSILLYRYFLTFNLLEIYTILSTVDFAFLEITQITIVFGLLFILIGLFFKIGIGPFGIWMSEIYEYGPLISVIIFSIIPKFGYFLFLLHLYLFTSNFLYFWNLILLIFGILSILIGTFGALLQIRLKKLLAYSSINYFGYILLTFVGFNIYSVCFCILYFLTYILISLFIWYVIILLEYKLKKNLYLIDLVYLKNENPIICIGFIFCILTLSGLPPMFLFYLKFITFNIILKNYIISIIFLLCNMISLFYYLRLIKIIILNNKKNIYFRYDFNLYVYYFLIFLIIFVLDPSIFYSFEFDENYIKNIILSKISIK